MGTKRSRHNKGHKIDKHGDLVSVVCVGCVKIFFQREQATKKGKGHVCPSCVASGFTERLPTEAIPQVKAATRNPRPSREAFLRTLETVGDSPRVGSGSV